MTLLEQIEAAAKPYGIIVEQCHKGVELLAPEGYCFAEENHAIVNSQWDNEPMPNVYRRALKDVEEYGPRLEKCPNDCSCKD